MNLPAPQLRSFLNTSTTVCFSRRTLLSGAVIVAVIIIIIVAVVVVVVVVVPLALQPFVGFGFLRQVTPSFPIHC
jgi:hypothetical protein